MEKSKPAPWWAWILTGLVASAIGIASALALTGGAIGNSKLVVGKWSTDPMVGATSANPWLRARIARIGLLALSKEETLYFDRNVDEAGNPLRANCIYEITGGPIPARWWSITIYDGQDFLPRNTDNAGSVDASRIAASGAENWLGVISPLAPVGNKLWISSQAAGDYSLTLRLYQPASTQGAELSKMAFPKVALMACSKPAMGGGQ
jgi:hypothetical protein